MGRFGKYDQPKVWPAKRSNEYGGRHRAAGGYKTPGQYRQGLLEDLMALYQSAKQTVKELQPEIKFFSDMGSIKPQGDKPTADEGQKAVNYLMSGLNDIIKKHTGFDPRIPQAEDTGLLMKAMRGSEKHNQEVEEVERQLR